MKKIIISVFVVIAVAILGLFAFRVFQKPPLPQHPGQQAFPISEQQQPQAPAGKCGDNICDDFEKANPDACPADCKISEQQKQFSSKQSSSKEQPQLFSKEQVSLTSPFGFHENLAEEKYFTDTGAKWIRLSGPVGLVWAADEPEKGKFDWSRLDRVINDYSKVAENILLTANSFNKRDQQMIGTKHKIPNDLQAYANYLKTAAKRYPQVNYWQIENEPANEWGDTPENFAKLIKISALAIKQINPKAKIVLGGAAVPGEFQYFYAPAIKELKRLEDNDGVKYFDAVDLHWSGQFEDRNKAQATYKTATISGNNYGLKEEITDIRSVLNRYSYDNVSIWITEMSDYSGKPADTAYLEASEKEQANEVFKRYVYSLAVGVKKIFWVALMEYHNYGEIGVNNYWDNVGLVNNPQNDGQSHKKLSYYTYKKMVEVLEGSDWNNIQTIQETGGVYIYKFTKNSKPFDKTQGKPIWVAWNDNSTEKQITISGINSNQVKVTETVPKYESGKEVKDYNTAFKTDVILAKNGIISLILKEKPVYIEEQ